VWQWHLNPTKGYSVRGVYDMLASQEHAQMQSDLDLIWHKQVPLKVSIFAWRLLRDRLPTKSNLATQGVISSDTRFCVASYGQVEDDQHLFLSCSTFGSLWPLVWSWIGFTGADTRFISDHFIQFIYSTGVLKSRRFFLQLIVFFVFGSCGMNVTAGCLRIKRVLYISY